MTAYQMMTEALSGTLLLADRGYFDVDYLDALNESGTHYVVRGYTSINPVIESAYDAKGRRIKRWEGPHVKHARLSKRKMCDVTKRMDR